MKSVLKILMLEDSLDDAEMIQRIISNELGTVEFKLVSDPASFIRALHDFEPALVLSDNTLPQMNGIEAMKIMHEQSFEIPFILITGTVSEDFAADIIKQGADDYILKDRLKRLPGAIEAALRKHKALHDKKIMHNKLVVSEEKYRLLFERNLAGVYQTDIEGKISSCNNAFARILGYESCYLIADKNAYLFHVKEKEKLLDVLVEQKKLMNYETILRHRNGQEVHVIENIALYKDSRTGEELIEGVVIDITERKKAEEANKGMLIQIAEQKIAGQKKISRAIIRAQEQERNHIGMELHDNINQILASAKLYLGMAGKKNETVKELLHYPMQLLDDSIDEIRSLSSKYVTPLRNVNLESLLQVIVDDLSSNGDTAALLVYNIADIPSDSFKLNILRILQEQVNNIIKHAAASNVTIILEDKEQSVELVVIDDGKGFDVRESRKGIGLSNIQNRVEAFDGSISVQSTPGKGTRTAILLPLKPE